MNREPPLRADSERRYNRLIGLGGIIFAILLAALVVFGNLCVLDGCPVERAGGSGILAVSCLDNVSSYNFKQLHYSIDSGSEQVLSKGQTRQHWLSVGDHRLDGYWAVWNPSTLPLSYDFEENIYVGDSAYGETTWCR